MFESSVIVANESFSCPSGVKKCILEHLVGIFVAKAKNTLYGSNYQFFFYCQKSLGY